MNQNSNAIITLCSHLCVGENIKPLEPKEWSILADRLMELGISPGELFEFSEKDLTQNIGLSLDMAQRIERLIDRNASLIFELGKYENMGIKAITRADGEYPAKLKKTLKNGCPPIFYCAGDLSLSKKQYIGYVGARNVTDDDIAFTIETINKTVSFGYGVVSGGAKGVDTVAEKTALELSSPVLEFLSDSMTRKLRKSDISREVRDGKLLLISVAKPDAGFNTGIAMMRNRYIYAASSGTVIVHADFEKGGTWAGATDNLKHNWCKTLCRDKKTYRGNQALIEKGAIPIDSDWDGNVDSIEVEPVSLKGEQLSLF